MYGVFLVIVKTVLLWVDSEETKSKGLWAQEAFFNQDEILSFGASKGLTLTHDEVMSKIACQGLTYSFPFNLGPSNYVGRRTILLKRLQDNHYRERHKDKDRDQE